LRKVGLWQFDYGSPLERMIAHKEEKR
jgi:hypothetical protein